MSFGAAVHPMSLGSNDVSHANLDAECLSPLSIVGECHRRFQEARGHETMAD